jgi:hypothetical protein
LALDAPARQVPAVGRGSGQLYLPQPGGLNEGTADFVALLAVARADDLAVAGNERLQGVYPVGQYVLGGAGDPGYYGIRRFPYSTDMTRNPLTLRHIGRRNRLPDTVPTPDPYADNAEVHSSGEVWATALWEGVAALVRRRGHPRSGPPRHEHRNVPRIRTIRSADMVGASSLARACSE